MPRTYLHKLISIHTRNRQCRTHIYKSSYPYTRAIHIPRNAKHTFGQCHTYMYTSSHKHTHDSYTPQHKTHTHTHTLTQGTNHLRERHSSRGVPKTGMPAHGREGTQKRSSRWTIAGTAVDRNQRVATDSNHAYKDLTVLRQSSTRPTSAQRHPGAILA
jgi:hypothetical protein